jgi:hypothetical protein
MIPSPYEALLLAFAAYRVWRLVAEDDLTDSIRRRFLRLGNWREEGDAVPLDYRAGVGNFLGCAWCLGFWVALAWWAAWLVWADTVIVAVPFALSAAVGFMRVKWDPPEA